MGIIPEPGRTQPRQQRLVAGTFRRIDDPAVDQDDCRQALAHIADRIAAGEDRRTQMGTADRWLDLFAVLEHRDELHRFGRADATG